MSAPTLVFRIYRYLEQSCHKLYTLGRTTSTSFNYVTLTVLDSTALNYADVEGLNLKCLFACYPLFSSLW